MDAEAPQREEALRAQLKEVRERLDGLVLDLQTVDGELDGLSTERRQHRLLSDVCGALEELRVLGGARLFWGKTDEDGERQVRAARNRVDVFEKRLAEIEARREAILEEIDRLQGNAEVIEDGVFELQREQEERKLEWIIEREVSALPARESIMPWTRGGEDDQRFRKTLATSLLVGVLIGLLLPQIDLPLPDPWEVVEVPERLTRLIQEQRPLPPPPPPEKSPVEPEPLEEVPLVAEPATPEATPEQKAKSKGLLAFRDKFTGLAASKTSARLGSQARITSSGEAASGRPERSMVATQAPGSSGGINLAGLSRDVGRGGGGQIEGVQVARATSSIAGTGGSERPLSDGPGLGRTDEEIQIVFDRHKAALYRLYNRELRRDPTLKGQMVLRIRIEPDGSVSLCGVQATDMNAPGLSAQVVARVKTFDFGAKEVPAITILYPIDFLPAT
jgi:hypothetical protein